MVSELRGLVGVRHKHHRMPTRCSGARLVGPGFESREARSWVRTTEESHNWTKWPSSASTFSLVVKLQLTHAFSNYNYYFKVHTFRFHQYFVPTTVFIHKCYKWYNTLKRYKTMVMYIVIKIFKLSNK